MNLKRSRGHCGFLLRLFASIVLAACSLGDHAMILEAPDVQFFKVEQTGGSPVSLRLTGLAFHSSYVVRGVSTARDGRTLRVLVQLALATNGGSGNLDHSVTIPDDVDAVAFGNKRVMIWQREKGVLSPQQ
jgi:hypothetical protein